MLGDTRCSEIITDAADCQHKGVVVERSLFDHNLAPVVHNRIQGQLFFIPIQPGQGAELEMVSMTFGMGPVHHTVNFGVQRAGCHFVQQRFPDMHPVPVDERYFGFVFAS